MKFWTIREKNFVKENKKDMTYAQMARKLKRTKHSVQGFVMHMVRTEGWTGRRLSESDKEYIRKHRHDKTYRQIADHLGRSQTMVSNYAGRKVASGEWERVSHERRMKAKNRWISKEEDAFIKENRMKMTNREIAKRLNKPYWAIVDYARHKTKSGEWPLIIHRMRQANRRTGYNGRSLSEFERAFILSHWSTMTAKEIGLALGRSYHSINAHIARLRNDGAFEKKVDFKV